MRTVSYEAGTAPAHTLVVSGIGRDLNPTARSGKPSETNLSAFTYDNKRAKHRGGRAVNEVLLRGYLTPTPIRRKNSGWITVYGGRNGLTTTFSPDALVVYAVVIEVDEKGNETEKVVQGITLNEYADLYC